MTRINATHDHGADHTRDDEAQEHARPGLLRSLRRQHEDAGADDRADAEHRQIEGAHRALQGSGFGDKLIHAFLTKQIHVLLS